MQQRLADIGAWMKVNGEAIYKSHYWNNRSDKKKENDLFYTVVGNDLYVICTKWKEQIEIPGISGSNVTLLGSNLKVKSKVTGKKTTIYAPKVNPGNMPCDYAWVYKIKNALK